MCTRACTLTGPLCPPIPEIQEVIPDRPIAQLGDRREHSLELVAADALDHSFDKLALEACFHAGPGRVAPVDEQEQEAIDLVVGEAELAPIRPARPGAGP